MSKIRCSNCVACELHKTAQHICLMGQGPERCDIMVVGEAPGYQEDESGQPFAGKAGRMLTELLTEAGLDRKKLYITNTVKCRPPDNRSPSQKEITACSKYLIAEIRKIKPKYVLLLGAVALKGALKKAGVTQLRGQDIEKDGVKYFITLHPAALFRQPQMIPYVKADFSRFARLVKGSLDTGKVLNWTLVDTPAKFRSCIHSLSKADVISYDLETEGLNPLDPNKGIICLGLAQKGHQWIIPFKHPESPFPNAKTQASLMPPLKRVLRGKKLVAHNGKFDNKWMKAKFSWCPDQTFDTLLAAYLLDENGPLGLKQLSQLHFNAPNYAIDTKSNLSEEPLEKIGKYCSFDVYYTLKLYELFREKLLEDKQLLRIFKYLLMPASRNFEDVELSGVYIEPSKYLEALKVSDQRVKDWLAKLGSFKDINWNSTQQISKYLYQELKLPVLEKTPTGNPSTSSESVLPRLKDKHPVVATLLNYREQIKLNQFLKNWQGHMVGEYIHPVFKLFGTVTGRLSCVDPNLQQVPRDTFLRSLITAPPGWIFVEADYSQVELRIAAMLSGDKTMKRAYQTGEDLHRKTAATILSINPENVTNDERKKAKACFTGDTEILTPNGWVRFDQYDGVEPVAQYDLNSQEITWTSPLSFRRFRTAGLLSFEDRNIDLKITSNHEVIWKNRNGEVSKIPAEKLMENGKSGYMINAGFHIFKPLLSDLDTRIMAMIASDGSFINPGIFRFGFKKPRKIVRFKQIMDEAGIPYSEDERRNVTHFRVNNYGLYQRIIRYLSPDKVLSWKSLGEVGGKTYLDEARYWDGHTDDRGNQPRANFTSCVEQTIDVMQAMATLSGIRAVKYPTDVGYKISYRPEGRTDSRAEAHSFSRLEGTYWVYCVQVPEGNIVVRRSGKVSIQGNCNFGFLYGMGTKKFQEYARDKYDVILSLEEAEQFRRRFFELYSDLPSWHERQRRLAKKYRYVRSPIGRKRRLPEVDSPEKYLRGEAERQAINSPVQGFASDLTLYSGLVRIPQELPTELIRPVGLVHDAFLCMIREDALDQMLPEIQRIMTDAETVERVFKTRITVPLEVEIKVGPWGSGKEWVANKD